MKLMLWLTFVSFVVDVAIALLVLGLPNFGIGDIAVYVAVVSFVSFFRGYLASLLHAAADLAAGPTSGSIFRRRAVKLFILSLVIALVIASGAWLFSLPAVVEYIGIGIYILCCPIAVAVWDCVVEC